MVDAEHGDDMAGVVQLVDDAVGAPPGGPQSSQLTLQRMTDPTRVLAQWPEHELDDSRSDPYRQSAELTLSRRSDAKLPAVVAHCCRNLARN
jgi:hypothetical protein